jgi:hypothetical protein
MDRFIVEPLVAGQLGDGTVMDTSTHPPVVSALEYELDGPTDEDVIESFPVFLVSEEMADRLLRADLRGFDLADASVVPSRAYLEMYGDVPHKHYRWLRPSPDPSPDSWVDEKYRLNVSPRMMRIMEQGNIRNAHVTPR